MRKDIFIKKRNSKYTADLYFNEKKISCLVGLAGIGHKSKEGDCITPIGTYTLNTVYYRKDKVKNIKTDMPLKIINKDTGWCTDSNSLSYNKEIKLPFNGKHESLYRVDECYDIIITTSFNTYPTKPDAGSAIFIHCIGKNTYTEGCIALDKIFLKSMLEYIDSKTKIIVEI